MLINPSRRHAHAMVEKWGLIKTSKFQAPTFNPLCQGKTTRNEMEFELENKAPCSGRLAIQLGYGQKSVSCATRLPETHGCKGVFDMGQKGEAEPVACRAGV